MSTKADSNTKPRTICDPDINPFTDAERDSRAHALTHILGYGGADCIPAAYADSNVNTNPFSDPYSRTYFDADTPVWNDSPIAYRRDRVRWDS